MATVSDTVVSDMSFSKMLQQLPDEMARHVAALVAFVDLQALASASQEARASPFAALCLDASRLALPPSEELASRVASSLGSHPQRQRLQRVRMSHEFHVGLVVESLSHVSSIEYDSSDSSGSGEAPTARFSRLRNLQKLHLRGLHTVDLSPLTPLRDQLNELSIRGTQSIKNAATISEFEELRVLDLEGSAVEDIAFVAPLSKLTTLNLNRTFRAINLEPLKSLRRLESLAIDTHELHDPVIFESFGASLRHLSCRDVVFPGDWNEALNTLPRLESMHGSELHLSFDTLVNVSKLKSLELVVPDDVASLEALATLPELTSCKLYAKTRRDHVRLARLSSVALSRITSISIVDLADANPSEMEDVGQCYRYLARLPALREAQFTGHPFCAKWIRLPRQLRRLELVFEGETWWGWDEFPQEILRNAKQLRVLAMTTSQPCTWDLSVIQRHPCLQRFQLS